MEKGKRELGNRNRDSRPNKISSVSSSRSVSICPACGSQAARENANYCLTCGKILSEDYEPLDTIRSSYRLQGKSFLVENAETEEITDLFARNENNVAHTAWACFVYSMVPYLGILFIPFTLVFAGYGLAIAHRYPHLGGRKLAMISIGMSSVILLLQVILWWLLYIIPEIVNPGI